MSSTVERRRERTDEPLLSVEGLKTHFPVNTGVLGSLTYDRDRDGFPFALDDSHVKAVDGVDFDLFPGETLGVVGESGCGKSTLARTVVGLEDPTAGQIRFDGRDVTDFEESDERWFRENVQMVFQDPMSSLNPRRKVGRIIADPLEAAGWSEEERKSRAIELLEQVGLEGEYYNRFPHEFSGGQRQRINLARALSINPDLVIADEPVSGLDMSVQAQILSLMADLQEEYGLTYLFITHDLGVVRSMADRVAVMYVGDFVEVGPTERLFTEPHHPYTRSLLDAVPNPNPDAAGVVAELKGDVPSPTDPPSGCKFHTRCPNFVLPDGFSEAGYADFASLREDVNSADLDASGDPQSVVESYFDHEVPSRVRRDAVAAVEAADTGDWATAREYLAEHASVCETETPLLEQVSVSSHQSACHLDTDDREEFTW
ncbi:ABC transporter ATP-binding protein [Halorussus halophilus]|uniref:ABC transporter ATP-binding protein n=1 Tax=Halorussus halophilus TaxID=2650975 RepID=UPI001300F326|nr:oligopeptide/dipeptide ABC transporter ATP-binding protein [Halorussus halophilus]